MKKIIAILLAVGAGLWANADVIVAYWDFGPDAAGYTETVSIENTVGVPTLVTSGTDKDADGSTGVSFVDALSDSHSAGQAAQWLSGVDTGDNNWLVSLDLTGYQNLTLRWDYRATSTGPTSADFEYKVGLGSWVSIETISLTGNSTYFEYSKDLSSISAIENQADVQFRLSNFTGGSGSGTYRMDNLQITAVPEPAALSMIGLGGLLILLVRRFYG